MFDYEVFWIYVDPFYPPPQKKIKKNIFFEIEISEWK